MTGCPGLHVLEFKYSAAPTRRTTETAVGTGLPNHCLHQAYWFYFSQLFHFLITVLYACSYLCLKTLTEDFLNFLSSIYSVHIWCQGHVRPISSGEQFFTVAINTPSPLPHFFYSARPLSSSSFSNPSATATSSLPERKSFTA